MIVSCPSCDSKYQVADEKVAGSMLRTRCKACGAQMVVDGTNPPPAGTQSDAGAHSTRPANRAQSGETGTVGKSKPPPPRRSTTPAPMASVKPPPPVRTQTGSHPIQSDKPGAAPVRPVVALNPEDALDPNAPSSDFYAKLLSKIGSPTSPSRPPAGAASASPGSSRSAPPHASQGPHGSTDVPAGDLYSRILAKVKPSNSDAPPPAATDVTKVPSEHKTLPPPPSWGPQPQEPRLSAEVQASGPGEIEIHVDLPGDPAHGEHAGQTTKQESEAAAVPRLALVPSLGNEPLAATNVQLPPINNPFVDSRVPASSAGAVATAIAPAATSASPIRSNSAAPAPKPEGTLEPSVKSTAPQIKSDFDPYLVRPQKRMAGVIASVLGVGLLGVGGGVAATIYALRPSLNAVRTGAQTATTSGPPAAAASVASTVIPSAAPVQSQAAADNATPQQEPQQAPDKASETSSRSKNVRTGALSGAHAGPTPVAAAPKVTSPTNSSVSASPDPKSAGKTNTNNGDNAAPAPAQTQNKSAGSGPFPRDVATAMLGVAASQAPSCKKPGGPTGTGKAIVTFDTDGKAVVANIVGEGFAGTPTGQCVAGLFRRVRVPPFAGERATAAKIFVIPP